MRYRNTSGHARVWPTLTDATTGRTLALGDGETAEIAGEVNDRHLSPVDERRKRRAPEDESKEN